MPSSPTRLSPQQKSSPPSAAAHDTVRPSPTEPIRCACSHASPAQCSVGHAHATHAPPPTPHVALSVPGRQLVPSKHPVQQSPSWHVPPAHVAASSDRCVHDMPSQPSVVHGLPSSQLVHAIPPVPHASTAVPG